MLTAMAAQLSPTYGDSRSPMLQGAPFACQARGLLDSKGPAAKALRW